MQKSTHMGMNRTGMDMSPIHGKAMESGAREFSPAGVADGVDFEEMEKSFHESAGTLGSVPVPGTLKGALKSAMDKMSGRRPEALLNKIGERLAFERSGTRLYEGMLRKCEAIMARDGAAPLPLEELAQIRDEEAAHFHLLTECMRSMGADPTAQTPDANASAVMSLGIQKVIADPRTSVAQCLEALLTAELADNAAWELLISLCEEMGLDEMAGDFRHALQQEETHVQRVRGWYEQAVMTDLGKATPATH